MTSTRRRATPLLGAVVVVLGCGVPAARPTAPLGPPIVTKPISFAILEDYDKGADLRQVARDFALFRELGVRVWRGSFGWDDYEPAPERYDFEWLEQFASLADTMGISLRPYIAYTPEWAGREGADRHYWNDPPRDLKRWTRFVEALAGRLRAHPSVLSYEIYNEENVPLWWDGTAEEYRQVLEAGARAVRRADPDAQVLLGGMVWPDPEWLEVVCEKRAAAFDIIPFHAYPETWTPKSVTVERYLDASYRMSFLSTADGECGRRPVWINEAGFATVPGKSERDQAEWWARAFATFLAAPRIEHLGIYEIRDQREGTPVIGDAPNYHLGLITSGGKPKLAFETVKLLLRLFGRDSITVADSELAVRIVSGTPGELHHHLFVRPDGRQLGFVWDRRGRVTVELELRRQGRRVIFFELDGRSSPARLRGGRVLENVRLEPDRVRVFEVLP